MVGRKREHPLILFRLRGALYGFHAIVFQQHYAFIAYAAGCVVMRL